MKNRLLLLLVAFGWMACQSNDSATFGVDPQLSNYSDEAPMTQKLFCNSVNCENPSTQEIYTYNPDGRLVRIDQFSRMASGQLEKVSYTDYVYTPDGQLKGKIRNGTFQNNTQWVAYEETEYVYTNGFLTLEKTYFNQHNPDQRVLTGSITYTYQDGKKKEQTWYDAQNVLSRRVVNDYRNNTVIRETWFGSTDNVLRRFEHAFAGNRRQISEFMPNSTEQISMVEKTYDAQGRLSSEETKVINPLLCSMQAGIIRYVY